MGEGAGVGLGVKRGSEEHVRRRITTEEDVRRRKKART